MKYTAEEVRKSADWLYQWERKAGARNARAMLTAYAERIEADEAKALGTCPKHGVEYVGECSGCAMTLPEKDFTHPPAQAAQVDARCEWCPVGRLGGAAEPVAHGEMGKEIEYSLWGLIHNGKVAGDPRQGAVDWHMRILIRQMVPHLIELAKLKGIRSQFDAGPVAQGETVPEDFSLTHKWDGQKWIREDTQPHAVPSVPDGWRETFVELLEDYAGARGETAAWHVDAAIDAATQDGE